MATIAAIQKRLDELEKALQKALKRITALEDGDKHGKR